MARITVKVTPNAKRNEIVGWTETANGGEALRIKLKAPPVDGKANRELIAFLAKTVGVPKGAVSIVRGSRDRLKTVEITGPTAGTTRALIDHASN